MNKYSKFIKAQREGRLQLEDKKMPMTIICKEDNSMRFIHQGNGGQIEAARTVEPLSSSAAVVYFEAQIKNYTCSKHEIAVGVIQKDCALRRHPGLSNLSIGYHSSGDIYINGKKVRKIQAYKSHSTIGIGIIYGKQQVFFTLNGKMQETIWFDHNSAAWPKFYPCISQRTYGDLIKLQFQHFKFDFDALKMKVEGQCLEQIDRETLDNVNMFSLVGDYLKFHGFSQTYSKLKDNTDFPELKSFIPHPFWQKRLEITEESKPDQSFTFGQGKSKIKSTVIDEEQEEIVNHRKSSTRQRIMSDYWGDILPGELPRKKNKQSERPFFQSRRKSSVISIEPDENPKIEEFQQPAESLSQSEQEKFLVNTRIKVLKLIRKQKIQEALKLLQENLPQLFEVMDYMQAYFHMQIYIRMIKNESPMKAMSYMRDHSYIFKNYKNELYPVYSRERQSIKFVSFTQLMGLVSLKEGTDHEALTSNQFYAFSNYINEVILKNMGVYPESRLDSLVNHVMCINSKNEQYQINGLSFLCDI